MGKRSAIHLFSILFFLVLSCTSYSQDEFYSVNSVFDDSPVEWKITSYDRADNEWIGDLRIKWPLRNDWSEWVIDFKNNYYTIQQLLDFQPYQWELIGNQENVLIQQKWRNDPNEWLLKTKGKVYKWNTVRFNDLNAWFLEVDDNEYFDMWTTIVGDSRDWEIEDKAASLPESVKLAAIFTTVYLTTPKN